VGHAAGDADRRPDEGRSAVTARARLGGCAIALAIVATPAAAQSWRTTSATRALNGEREMTVNLQYGAGRFHLERGAGGELYRMQMRYDEDKFVPVREYDADALTLRLGLRNRSGRGINVSMGDRHRGETPPSFDLWLSPDVPLALTLEMGAVQADADLGGLMLRRLVFRTGASQTHLRFGEPNTASCEELTIEAGAAEFQADRLANANCERVVYRGGVGEVTLDFSGSWRRSMTADITVGIGSLKLRLPRDVGVSVHLNRFLASFDAAGFDKRGSMYYSTNYAQARYRLTLNVNASLGGVDVAWVND
jgi:Cell wall-active antibiotics response 4TMS YvqF/N-terminal domain of toast_rack, DUF2154